MPNVSLEQQLDPGAFTSLVEGIARGEYNLLLGAGASIGAEGGSGSPLPSANDLKVELINDFELPAEPGDVTLPEVYEAAMTRRDAAGRDIVAYFRDRFTQCRPASWHYSLTQYSCRRIWTLNIDDVVERVYSSMPSSRQRMQSINWIDPHRDPHSNSEVQVVHLHGKADQAQKLIFSIIEYFGAAVGRRTWPHIFGDHFQDSPFIVVGARLNDEVDLADIIRRGSASYQTYGRPSVVVLKEVKPLQREQFTRANLIPIELTGESFFHEIREHVEAAEKGLATQIRSSAARPTPEQLLFLDQFSWLRPGAYDGRVRQDFYAGYDPTWADIIDGRDAKFEVVSKVTESVLTSNKQGPSQRLELLHGPWGTGKTTALYRIGFECLIRGMDVFLFRGESRLEVDAVVSWVRQAPKSVFLFDGVADHVIELDRLFSRCNELGIGVQVVGTERQSRVRQVYSSLDPSVVSAGGAREMQRLSDPDIDALIEKLRQKTRLGRITRRTLEEQQDYFISQARRQLFVGMSRLEGGSGFVGRVRGLLGSAQLDPSLRDLLAYVSFPYYFGYQLPVGLASNVSGIPAARIVELASADLQEWIRIARHGLQLRHRYVATLVVERALDASDRYRLSQALARAYSPQIDISAITNRTKAYLFIRNLLDSKRVSSWIGPSTPRWYAELEEDYGWNARYWEQRALAHMRDDDFPAARSYAERGLQIHRDPFTLTTLANVILRMAVATSHRAKQPQMEEYWEGVELLRDARDQSRIRADHAYSVFFNQSLRFARAMKRAGGISGDFKSEFNDWLLRVSRTPLVSYPEFSKSIMKVREEWLRLATTQHD